MDKNNKSIFIIIISLALVVITGTFAWLNWRSQNTAMVLTIGDIRGLTVTLKPYQINKSLSPVASYTDGIAVDVTAANAKNEADNFKLFYKIDTIDDALKDEGFKYTITKCTANCDNANNYSVLNDVGGNFVGAINNSNLEIYSEELPANTTYKYKVYLWIDSSSGNQANMQNKTFSGELRASITSSLYDLMRDNSIIDNVSSTYVTNENGIQFDTVSSDTNGKGVYIRKGTENDTYPIYYYRGEVDNNNVLFAGFCWKIIRTTSTGGTKLIYNGLPSGTNNNQCTNTTGTATQLAATSYYNKNYISPAGHGYMLGASYPYTGKNMANITDTYMYGTDYDATTHSLVAENAISFAGTEWADNYKQIGNNHYTCFNATGECQEVYYIYFSSKNGPSYIKIPSGKNLEIVLDEMVYNPSNTVNSDIKNAVDNWYSENMQDYTSYLEDTVWCNDRRICILGAWDPSNGSYGKYMLFGLFCRSYPGYDVPGYEHVPSFECNHNDSFTVSASNGNGKLTYPVGLITGDEIMLAGGQFGVDNTNYYLYTNQTYFGMTPYRFYPSGTNLSAVNANGRLYNAGGDFKNGVRPVVSLKQGTKFSGGTGIATDPYVVE